MLQGRLFAYADAHRYRLGVNYHQVAVNKPLSPVKNYHRDGGVRTDGNGGKSHNYHPNSFDEVNVTREAEPPPFLGTGGQARYDHRIDEDYYSQAGALYRMMTIEQRALLINNIVGSLRPVPEFIQRRQIEHFMKADKEYGMAIMKGLELSPKK